jgi:ArsR family transcriptional regulator
MTYVIKIDAKDFKALGDPTRLKIIDLLSSQKRHLCVCAIAQKIGISQPAVSQHLRILKNANLVTSIRRGYYVHYSINPKTLKRYSKSMDTMYKKALECCSLLDSPKCCPVKKKKKKK